MNPQNADDQFAGKTDHDLLVMLIQELRSIRRLLEVGHEYRLSMDESRSGAWGATYSGKVETISRIAPPPSPHIDSKSPFAQFTHLEPWLSDNVMMRLAAGKDDEAVKFIVGATGMSAADAREAVRHLKGG